MKSSTNELVCVKTFNTRLDADLARAVLASHGITSAVCGDDCGGSVVELVPTSGGIRLVVSQSDTRAAARILRTPKP